MKEEYKLLRKESRLATKEKRKNQICKVFEIKLDKSHLSKEKVSYLNRLFLEAKWLYNNIISSDNVFEYDTKIKKVNVLNKEGQIEHRDLTTLSAQMRAAIRDRTTGSIKALSTKKKKGRKKEVGRLKYKSYINSVPLKQFGMTYKIKNKNYISIQGFKKDFKVIGLKQIPENAEYANANLIRKSGNHYLKVTVYVEKKEKPLLNNAIGLDFGIKDNIIDNFGNRYNFMFPETKQIKKFSKKMNKLKKGSQNRFKVKLKLQKAYEENTNRKKDVKNKFVSMLVNNYDYVCIQDEQIASWKKSKRKGWGRRIHHSIMGGVISELKRHSETLVIDRFFPSTKLCPACGQLNKPSLDDRVYICDCGYSHDRDTHSANNILNEGLRKISTERTNTMPVEKMLDFVKSYDFRERFLLKQEAQVFRLG